MAITSTENLTQTLKLLGIFPGVLQCVCRTDRREHEHCHWDRYWVRAGPTAGHYFSILPVQVHKWIHQMKCLPVQDCAAVKKRKNDRVIEHSVIEGVSADRYLYDSFLKLCGN